MKPAASLLALALTLASSFAFASPSDIDARDNVKIEKKEETKKDASKDVKKPSKHHSRATTKGRAHSDKAASGMVPASMRTPASTKETAKKSSTKKKTDKKSDTKHPTTAGLLGDPGASVHESENFESGHAEPTLPPLPPPVSPALKNASAHEVVVRDQVVAKETKTRANRAPKKEHDAKTEKAPCKAQTVEFLRGAEIESFPLAHCDGTPIADATDRLSILLRPGAIAKPLDTDFKKKQKAGEIAHGIKRADAGLTERLEKFAHHFKSEGHAPKIAIVSGYRPTSAGSFHALARAIDFRIEGVDNEKLVEFCKTLPDTGCGYYPRSSFIHMDVRDAGTGHASWIDASGPGETPNYVSTWPLPANTDSAEKTDKSDAAKKNDSNAASSMNELPNDPYEKNDDEKSESSK